MTFPSIPDINPDIGITFEDAVNLLLASIALEEISLSELINAEIKKTLFILDHFKDTDSLLRDAMDLNRSVNQTIKNVIKLRMLLQFKLDSIIEMLPKTNLATTTTSTKTETTTTTATTTTTTTTITTKVTKTESTFTTARTCTTTSTSSTSTTTTINNCEYSQIEGEEENILDQLGEFFCNDTLIKECVCANSIESDCSASKCVGEDNEEIEYIFDCLSSIDTG
ncbi:UNVERIFIED_CONTAM: hypothetical protein Cloal_3467 [Acetivibrio alkalicellulosi]